MDVFLQVHFNGIIRSGIRHQPLKQVGVMVFSFTLFLLRSIDQKNQSLIPEFRKSLLSLLCAGQCGHQDEDDFLETS